MPDMTAITQALGAFKALKDIAQAMIGLRDSAAFRERQIEFQQRIIDAQDAISVMQAEHSTALERVRYLEKEIADLKAWEAEKEKYELKDVGHGAFAYLRKPDAEPPEEPHWLCPNCYTSGNKSIFSRSQAHNVSGTERQWTCPRCKAGIFVHWSASPRNPAGTTS